MITILGLLLFFVLTGLILWHFNEAVWRVENEEDRDSTRIALQGENPILDTQYIGFTQLGEENSED